MQLPDMNLLVALDALLDEGSVVGAARRMNLSPAAMSRTLTRIREAVGDPILVRAGRGLVPTPKALQLQGQVRNVVEQAALLFRSADQVDLSTLRRRFSVRANDFFIGVYGGRLFDTMERMAPLCELCFVPEGDTDDESRDLLAQLYAHSVLPENIYRHQWQPHDLVFWDNRSLIHLAAGCPSHLRRKLYRTTIQGDAPF